MKNEQKSRREATSQKGAHPVCSGNPFLSFPLRLPDVPLVGVSHGNYYGDVDLEVVLPNGAVCPPSDHGVPAFDAGAHRFNHAVAEANGVMYIIGGRVGGVKTGKK